MKTILVPTDFSPVAKNAALYAIGLAKDLNAATIVLFNAYQPVPLVITEPATTTMTAIDIETIRDISDTGIQSFKKEIEALCPAGITVEARNDFASISEGVNDICEETGAQLIVMGITGASKIEEMLIGSTSTSVMKNTKVPVIIVPEGAKYSTIKNIMLACDYKKVAETVPVKAIKWVLRITNALLHVVNVNDTHKELSSEKVQQQELIRSLFAEHNPRFHIINHDDFITGINDFVEANGIDIIIAVPKKHSFFEGLFKERHTKKLAFHSHVPLMSIHEEDL